MRMPRISLRLATGLIALTAWLAPLTGATAQSADELARQTQNPVAGLSAGVSIEATADWEAEEARAALLLFSVTKVVLGLTV